MKIFRSGAYESFYDMPLTVQWNITMKCNYRCSYCFVRDGAQNRPPSKKPFSTLNQLKAAVDNIASLNRPWYNIVLVGGEPTVHPHILDAVRMLHETLQERLNNICFITNGSRNNELYRKLAEMAKSVSLTLLISIHTDHVDMAHILELIEKLSHNIAIHFALMFNPAKREEVQLIYDILYEYRKNFPFSMSIDMIFTQDVHFDSRYTKEDFSWQRSATEKFNALENSSAITFTPAKEAIHSSRNFYDLELDGKRKIVENVERVSSYKNELRNFSGMYCIANTAVIEVEEDGLCRGMICGAAPYICNIFEEGLLKAARADLIHAVICPFATCGCITNERIPKFASRLEAARFIEIFDAKQQALFDAAQ